MVFLWIAALLTGLTLLISYVCYRITFYVPKRAVIAPNEYPIPPGEIYECHRQQMVTWMDEVRGMPCRKFSITAHDGLTLWGKYYEYAHGAPIEIMFHGYRGSAERDLCGGVQRAFALGYNALLVDQRTSGQSEGNVISFGVNEHQDCLRWVNFVAENFPDSPIILTGISMGATTVLMAAGQKLHKNVVGVLADCGYTSAREIIQVVTCKLRLPPKVVYPFIRLGASLYGKFHLDAADAVKALQNCKVPVIFFHGEDDDFVPCYMSKKNYSACPTHKKLVIIPGADHGLSYLVDPKQYLQALDEFFAPIVRDFRKNP